MNNNQNKKSNERTTCGGWSAELAHGEVASAHSRRAMKKHEMIRDDKEKQKMRKGAEQEMSKA